MSNLAPVENRSEVAVRDEAPPRSEIMGVIMEAVRDERVDTAKMEALFRLKREEEDRQAQRAFNRAFVRCKAEIQPVFKNKKNEQTKSKYADALSLADRVDPIMDKYGFAITYGTEPSDRDGYYRMVADLLHEDGHEKRYVAEIPQDKTGIKGNDNKTDTHAFGSSMTYGRRYMKLMIWDVATKDDDGQAAGRDEGTMTAQQVEHLRRLLSQTDLTEDRFVEYLQSQNFPGETLEAMPFSGYENARRALEKRIRSTSAKSNQEAMQ